MNRILNKKNRTPLLYLIGAIGIMAVMSIVVSGVMTQAQILGCTNPGGCGGSGGGTGEIGTGDDGDWPGPSRPPTVINQLPPVLDFSDFIWLYYDPSDQIIEGPMRFSNRGVNPSLLGFLGDNTGIAAAPLTSGNAVDVAISPVTGLPVIAYQDDNMIKIVRCELPDCTKRGPVALLDENAEAHVLGDYLTLEVLPTTDLPVVAYYDANDTALKVRRCGTPYCDKRDAIMTVDTGHAGSFVTSAMGAVGPVFAYRYVGSSSDVKIALCTSGCGSVTVKQATLPYSAGDVSIAISSSGSRPVFAYTRLDGPTTESIYFSRCGNSSCDAISDSNQIISTTGTNNHTLLLDEDNRPLVIYTNNADQVRAAYCYLENCSGGGRDSVVVSSGVAGPVSAVRGADGKPLIIYATISDDLIARQCDDFSCATSTTVQINKATISGVDTTIPLGASSDIAVAIGNDALPISVFRGDTSVWTEKSDSPSYGPTFSSVRVAGYGGSYGPWFSPLLPFPDGSDIGIFGYAKTQAVTGAYGLYGMAGYSGKAIYGSAAEPQYYGGLFFGPVVIEENTDTAAPGTLTVSHSLSAEQGIEATGDSITGDPAIEFSSTAVSGMTPLIGVTNGGDDLSIGINGLSTGHAGVFIASMDAGYGLRADSAAGSGIRAFAEQADTSALIAESFNKPNSYGVRGVSDVIGIRGEVIENASSLNGAGIYACGTDAAASFNGNVAIVHSLAVGIASESATASEVSITPKYKIDEATLRTIICACKGTGGCSSFNSVTCP